MALAIISIVISIIAIAVSVNFAHDQKILNKRKVTDTQYTNTEIKASTNPDKNLNAQDQINIMRYQENRANERAEKLSNQIAFANFWLVIIGIYFLIKLIILLAALTALAMNGAELEEIIATLL